MLLAFDLDAVLGLVAVFVLAVVLGLGAVEGLAGIIVKVEIIVYSGVIEMVGVLDIRGIVLTGVFRVSSGENLIVCVLTLPVAGLPDILKYTHKKIPKSYRPP